MKNHTKNLFYLSILVFLVNLSSQKNTGTGSYRVQEINFSGTLTSQQGNVYEVDNISISNMIDQIFVYEMQKITNENIKTTKGTTTYITLSSNPTENTLVSQLDLHEIAKILSPEPNTIYTFQTKEKYPALEYVKITVVSNDAKKTKTDYLISTKLVVYCHGINGAGPINDTAKFTAIKELVIKGFEKREDSEVPTTPKNHAKSKKKIKSDAGKSGPVMLK